MYLAKVLILLERFGLIFVRSSFQMRSSKYRALRLKPRLRWNCFGKAEALKQSARFDAIFSPLFLF